jgi:hypothetical protein
MRDTSSLLYSVVLLCDCCRQLHLQVALLLLAVQHSTCNTMHHDLQPMWLLSRHHHHHYCCCCCFYQVVFSESAAAFDPQLEQTVACQLAAHLNQRLAGYK